MLLVLFFFFFATFTSELLRCKRPEKDDFNQRALIVHTVFPQSKLYDPKPYQLEQRKKQR